MATVNEVVEREDLKTTATMEITLIDGGGDDTVVWTSYRSLRRRLRMMLWIRTKLVSSICGCLLW